MKKQIFVLLIFVNSYNCIAQVDFEKGYFINNEGQQINCLIKNVDWKNNPTKFLYKLSKNEASTTANINAIREFGFSEGSKYIRVNVGIDRSSSVYSNLSSTKKVILNQEQLFLKVLVEGDASLFFFEERSLRRFFLKTKKLKTEQLIYKKYRNQDDKVGENNGYKQQLLNSLKCQNISMSNIESIDYKKSDLINLIIKYNECSGSLYTAFTNKEKSKSLFNLNIRPGITHSSLSLDYLGSLSSSDRRDPNFDSEIGFRLGVEAEIIMPFNNNKWAILIEPTYQYYKSNKKLIYSQFNNNVFETTVKTDYESIELPIGIRHYSYLNDNFKLFLNLSLIIDMPLSSSIYAERVNSEDLIDLEINSRLNAGFGIGFNYKTYSLEVRMATRRELLGVKDIESWISEYKSLSLIFGYTIF